MERNDISMLVFDINFVVVIFCHMILSCVSAAALE